MIISRLNYEVFLIDYLDGKLSPSMVDELLLFLDQNPDIKNDLDGVQDAVLVAENTIFPNKTNLKKKSFYKDGIDNEFEYLCIASAEGVITQEESISLQNILNKDLIKRNQFHTFQKLKIASDTSIGYSNKLGLKRTPIIPIRYSNLRLSISIAASIAILVGVYSIGRLMVSNNPLENFSTSSVAVSYTPPNNKAPEVSTNKNAIESKEPRKENTTNRIIERANPIAKEETKARINIEESIPNIIHRIDFQGMPTEENHNEEIALLAAKYAPDNKILLDQLYAQQESNRTKEFGAFEAMQYGVRSIGRLFGRDLKLDANKDEKGKIEKIIFESKLVAFSTQVNNNE